MSVITDIPKTLREIADKVESGEMEVKALDFNYPPVYDPQMEQWIANFRMLVY